jgi:phosphonate transport system substrate-binding protein
MSHSRCLVVCGALVLGALMLVAGCKPSGGTQATATAGATGGAQTAGAYKGPVKMYFVPSIEAGKIMTHGRKLGDYLTEKLGVRFEVEVAPSYAAVIEGLGSSKVDVAWMPTYAYIIAHDKYKADVALMCVRRGQKAYRGMFVVRSDSGIEKLEDLEGKTIAYTDAASTSGYIYPSAMLAAKGIRPKRHVFAGGHQQAMLDVYDGTTDAGCAYWSPAADDGEIKDARKDILSTHPDAKDVLKTIAFTEWIPNDNLSFRADFAADLRQKIVDAILEWVKTDEGAKEAASLSDVTGFEPATDADYDVVRELIAKSGQAPEEVLAALEKSAQEKAAKAAASPKPESAAPSPAKKP